MATSASGNRYHAQIIGIWQTVQEILDKNGIKAHQQSARKDKFAGSSVAASQASESNSVTLELGEQKYLKIKPLVAGSHGCNELCVEADPGFRPHLNYFNLPASNDHPRPLNPTLFHSRFSPLAQKLSKQFCNASIRVLILTNQYEGKGTPPHIDNLYEAGKQLASLNIDHSAVSILVVGNQKNQSGFHKAALNQIQRSVPVSGSIDYLQVLPEDSFTRFSLLGKSSFSISGSQATIHDSLLAGCPVLAWNGTTVSLASSLNEHLHLFEGKNHFQATTIIAEKQRQLWWTTPQAESGSSIIHNNRQDLAQLVEQWITSNQGNSDADIFLVNDSGLNFNELIEDAERQVDSLETVMPLMLTSPMSQSAHDQLKFKMRTSQRKINKFRRSPRRFLEDSQHPWLVPLKR